MLEKTKGIVLHRLKYGDNSLIVNLYTENFGRMSFIVHGLHNKKSKNKIAWLQPSFMLCLEIYKNNRKGIHQVKEFSPDYLFSSIPYHDIKRTVVLFLSEVLYRVLKEEEENFSMFNFIREALIAYDLMDNNYANFHLFFLMELTKHLGFYPQNNFSQTTKYFDLIKGVFKANIPEHKYFIEEALSEIFSNLLKHGFEGYLNFDISRAERSLLLEKIIVYFKHHFELTTDLRSIDVMRQIFR